MKLKHTFFAVIAATAVALPFVHAAAPDTTSAPGTTSTSATSTDQMTALFGDPVLAKGTGVNVKRSDLDAELTGIKSEAAARGQEIPPDQMTQIEARLLDQLIDVQLLMQQANADDKAQGTKKADDAMATLKERYGSGDALNMQLKAIGTTEDQFKGKISEQATAMATLQRQLGITVTDADIKKFYDDHPADFEQSEMVHVRHILLMTIDPTTRAPLADDVVKAKRKEADDILMKARSGEDFSKLAATYSEDPMTKDKGGELPPFPKGQMLPEFEAAAFSLTNNQISDVVTTVYGFHIIKFIDRTPAKKLTLSDKVPGSDVTISDRVKDILTQQKEQLEAPAYLAKLKKAANVEITDPELNAAVQALPATGAAPGGAAMPGEK